LSEYRVRELIRDKQIRATKIGQWKINPEDLQEFIKSGRIDNNIWFNWRERNKGLKHEI